MQPENIGKFCYFIDQCNNVEGIDGLKDLIRNGFRQIFPHQMATCGIGQLCPTRIIRVINVDFPASYLQKVIRPDQTIANPVFACWTSTQRPWLVRVEKAFPSAKSCRHAERDHRIENIASYGVVDGGAATFSYFAFGNIHASVIPACQDLLLATVPHLHVSLIRVLTRNYLSEQGQNTQSNCVEISPQGAYARDSLRLTEREKQILEFICRGKSNREIGDSLSISESTVKTHVKNLLAKLSVTSRTEAAAKAINTRLLGSREDYSHRVYD